MDLTKVHMHVHWVENREGHVAEIDPRTGESPDAKLYPFYYSRPVRELRTEVFCRDGLPYHGMEPMGAASRSWSEELVLAMATGANGQLKHRLTDAIIYASEACERCMNALAYQYGLDWGYDECDPQYLNSRTRCKMCTTDLELEMQREKDEAIKFSIANQTTPPYTLEQLNQNGLPWSAPNPNWAAHAPPDEAPPLLTTEQLEAEMRRMMAEPQSDVFTLPLRTTHPD